MFSVSVLSIWASDGSQMEESTEVSWSWQEPAWERPLKAAPLDLLDKADRSMEVCIAKNSDNVDRERQQEIYPGKTDAIQTVIDRSKGKQTRGAKSSERSVEK